MAAKLSASHVWAAVLWRLANAPEDRLPVALFECLGMLNETIRAFDSGQYFAASVTCRATVESAGYLFLTRKEDLAHPGVVALEWPVTASGEVRRVEFDEILKALGNRGALSTDLLKKADAIRENGNFIAHFASRFDVEYDEWRKAASAAGGAGPLRKLLYPYPTEAEVLSDIEAAWEIILGLSAAWAQGKGGPSNRPHGLS